MRPRRSVRDRVLRAARDSSHLNVVQIAALVGCHRSTASKHLNRCHGAALALLTRGSDSDARRDVAGRPNCPPRLLVRLADDPDMRVRGAAAGNGNCPAAALDRLGVDSDADVRGAAAANPNCRS